MKQQVEIRARDAILVEDAALIRMMGMPVLEALPSPGAPYERTDPFILVHEGRFRLSEMASKDTKHPHQDSTTSGTCCGARRAPATTRARAEPWKGTPVRGIAPVAQDWARSVARRGGGSR